MVRFIAPCVASGRVKKLYSKNSIITHWYIGKRIKVYCGNKFTPLVITRGMVGYKFGQFIMTKRMGNFIHRKKQKRKLGKKKK